MHGDRLSELDALARELDREIEELLGQSSVNSHSSLGSRAKRRLKPGR